VSWRIVEGECVEAMRAMPEASVDAVVCDPPYGLEFMGREWDSFKPSQARIRERVDGRTNPTNGKSTTVTPESYTAGRPFQAWCETWAREALRVLKPGGHLLAFGGSRTYHRMASGIEDAGFEIRDALQWLYGQGFPKSLNVGCRCGESQAQHDVRPMLNADLSEAFHADDQCGQVLLEGVPESGTPADGTVPAARRAGASQWRVEGRRHAEAPEGELRGRAARPGAGVGAADGSGRRLHSGAPAGDGDHGGPTADANGSRAPSGSRPVEQLEGEPRDVAGQPDAQARGAWPTCERCGQPAAGLGTALKPSHEPVVVARKPLAGTVAATVLAHGTGALNIDGCRLEGEQPHHYEAGRPSGSRSFVGRGNEGEPAPFAGRWPANVILDEEAAAMLDAETGPLAVNGPSHYLHNGAEATLYGDGLGRREPGDARPGYGDSSGASRFYYVAKASSAERNAGLDGFEAQWAPTMGNGIGGKPHDEDIAEPKRNVHPTVKPIDLMRWLVRLVTPPGGTVLDPFTGSGTTGIACALERFEFVGIEREAEYAAIARARLAWWSEHPDGMELVRRLEAEREVKAKADAGQLDLFAVAPARSNGNGRL
jgi:DNA modification methylase